MTGAVPRLSVVIPTYKRPALLQRCLQAVLSQTLPGSDYEVIVVDDGHTADTEAVVQALSDSRIDGPRIQYLHPVGDHGPAIARNLGWRRALGEVVAFTDDDTLPAPDWLARGLAAMQATDAAGERPVALCGRVHVPLAPHERQRPTDHQRMTLGLETAEFVTANAFVRRDGLARIGGFDERFRRAWREDSDLQFRLQQLGTIGKCPDAVVAHPVRQEPWGICLRQQRNTFFDALLYKKHPRLYRARIRAVPPWHYYLIVGCTALAVLLVLVGQGGWALVSLLAALIGVARFAVKRLHGAASDARHVVEMAATSALIPFLSVYWRLRGALHFRVLFL